MKAKGKGVVSLISTLVLISVCFFHVSCQEILAPQDVQAAK